MAKNEEPKVVDVQVKSVEGGFFDGYRTGVQATVTMDNGNVATHTSGTTENAIAGAVVKAR